jgi:hypothetical protein
MPDNQQQQQQQQQRTVGDLDPDRTLWVADSNLNRSVAHLDRECRFVRATSKPRTPRVLHHDLRLCKKCDPTYEIVRPGSRTSPAWELRKQGGGE